MITPEPIYIEFTDGGYASGFEADLPSVLRMYIEDRLKEGKQVGIARAPAASLNLLRHLEQDFPWLLHSES